MYIFFEKLHILDHPRKSRSCEKRVERFLIASTRIGTDTVSLSGETYCRRIEAGRFPDDIFRRFTYGALHTSYHSSDRDGSVRICYDHIFRSELVFCIIEGEDFFSFFRLANRDITYDLIRIEGVHRLTELSHDEIGDIDDIHLGRESCTFHHESDSPW